MVEVIDLHDLTDEEVAFVKGLVEKMRKRHEAVHVSEADAETEHGWGALSAAAFAQDWDNEQDAVYDDWRERYGVPER